MGHWQERSQRAGVIKDLMLRRVLSRVRECPEEGQVAAIRQEIDSMVMSGTASELKLSQLAASVRRAQRQVPRGHEMPLHDVGRCASVASSRATPLSSRATPLPSRATKQPLASLSRFATSDSDFTPVPPSTAGGVVPLYIKRRRHYETDKWTALVRENVKAHEEEVERQRQERREKQLQHRRALEEQIAQAASRKAADLERRREEAREEEERVEAYKAEQRRLREKQQEANKALREEQIQQLRERQKRQQAEEEERRKENQEQLELLQQLRELDRKELLAKRTKALDDVARNAECYEEQRMRKLHALQEEAQQDRRMMDEYSRYLDHQEAKRKDLLDRIRNKQSLQIDLGSQVESEMQRREEEQERRFQFEQRVVEQKALEEERRRREQRAAEQEKVNRFLTRQLEDKERVRKEQLKQDAVIRRRVLADAEEAKHDALQRVKERREREMVYLRDIQNQIDERSLAFPEIC